MKEKFNSFPIQDRARLVVQYSRYLISRDTEDYHINLYILVHDYVEVWHNIHTDTIDDIRIISYPDLDKYLTTLPFVYSVGGRSNP